MGKGDFSDRDGFIWFDGQMVPWREANVHILTHAMHYASAVFEGERSYGGKIFRSRDHSKRLLESGKTMLMDIPWSADEIEEAKYQLLEANQAQDSYFRVIAWRGTETMGLTGSGTSTHMAVAAWDFGIYYGDAKARGARLSLARWRRPPAACAPCHAKASGLYMICTMTKMEAEAQGYSDSLMLDYEGNVAEATSANIFFVRGQEVITPRPDNFLNGITKQTVEELLRRRNIAVVERPVRLEELATFEQCFLTGSAAEITPVVEIAEHKFVIGDLVKQVIDDFNELVRQ